MDNTKMNTRYVILTALTLLCLILPRTAQAASPAADDQSLTVDEDTSINILLSASDQDGDSLTYSIVSNPVKGNLTGTAPNLSYKPDANYNGSDSFTFKVNDGTSDSNTATVSLTINPINDVPTVSSVPDTITLAIKPEESSASKTYTLLATDADSDSLTYSTVGLPSGAGFNTQTGEITWIVTHQDIGSYPNITFTVSDGQSQASKTVTLAVREAVTYYLDAVNGDDGNSGTSALPWKTVTKAFAILAPGDTVLLRTGTYGEIYRRGYSGHPYQNTDWITWKADTGQVPEVTRIFIGNSQKNNVYLIFDGFTVKKEATDDGCAVEIGLSDHVRLLNLNIIGNGYNKGQSGYGESGISCGSCREVIVDNCTIGGLDEYNRYSGFTCGIRIGGCVDSTVTNCDISCCWRGMGIGGKNILIARNNIRKMNGDCITFAGVNGLTLEDNEIHDLTLDSLAMMEIPTETTWSQDGLVMTNSNAKWNTPGETRVYAGSYKLRISSGNNVHMGDGTVDAEGIEHDFVIASVDSDTQLTLAYSPKLDLSGPAPSNVNYIIQSIMHADGMQAQASSYDYNVIIRRNKWYDVAHQIWWLNPRISKPEGGYTYGGFNWLIENNLFYQSKTDPTFDRWSAPNVQISYVDGLIFRNNTCIGMYKFENDNHVQIYNNIISYMAVSGSAIVTGADYNIINRGYAPTDLGAHTLWFHPGAKNEDYYAEPQFWGMFTDPGNADFRPALPTSLQISHSDQENSPSLDLLGKLRDAQPDAGCYEYSLSIFRYGDVSGDNEVTAFDAALVAQASVGSITLTADQTKYADVSGDNEVSAFDAALIAQHAVGLISVFPAESRG